MKKKQSIGNLFSESNLFLLRADVLNVCSFIKFKGETKVEEIKKKEDIATMRYVSAEEAWESYKKDVFQGNCIIYLIAAFILQFKVNSFFCGAVTTFIYAITIDIDARVSAERTMKKLENMKK